MGLAVVILLPIIGGLFFGLLQVLYYKMRVAGGMKEEDVPFFGLLFFRGMFMMVVVACLSALWLFGTEDEDAFKDFLNERDGTESAAPAESPAPAESGPAPTAPTPSN